MANEEHLAELRKGVNVWNQWRLDNEKILPDLAGADLNGINLSADVRRGTKGANLNGANLIEVNLSGANLFRTDLIKANLSEANFNGANLSEADFREANLNRADLRDVDLFMANLSGANLSNADLSQSVLNRANLRRAKLGDVNLFNADLTETNLSEANLSYARLVRVQALGTNFTSARLTGVCLEDWNTNRRTQLVNVICEYVYLQESRLSGVNSFSDRRPSDPNCIFAPGEFTKLFQKALETVDLIFADGIDWKAFFQSFQELRSQYDDDLSVQAIEKKSGGAFVIRLEVPPEADNAAIESQAKEFYSEKLKLLESSYQTQLQIQGENLEHERNRNSQLMRVVEVMAENTGPKYDLRNANIGNLADVIKDNARQQTNQYNYESPEKQSLAEAATEIQRLLKVLEVSNPMATEAEQKAFVNAGVSPTMKQRAVGSLQAGGKAALEEFLDNPYVNVGMAIVEGWREAK